jgi:hypothetical protein
MKKLVFSLIALTLASLTAMAQNASDSVKLYPGKYYFIVKSDSTYYICKLLNQDDQGIMVDAIQMGIVSIRKSDISYVKDTIGKKEKKMREKKEIGEPYIYGEIGGGDGSHDLFQMTLNIVYSKNNIISISYYYVSHRSATPSDYQPGIGIPAFPQQVLSVFGLSYGKVFFSKTPYVRYILKGGLCAGVTLTPVDFVNNGTGGFLSSNYNYSNQEKFVIGAVLNPVIEFPIGRGFGFSIGPYVNVNAVSSVLAVEATMLFGHVRNKTYKEIHRPKRYRRHYIP